MAFLFKSDWTTSNRPVVAQDLVNLSLDQRTIGGQVDYAGNSVVGMHSIAGDTVANGGKLLFNVGGQPVNIGPVTTVQLALNVAGTRSKAATTGTTQTGVLRIIDSIGTLTLDMGTYDTGGSAPFGAWLQVTNPGGLSQVGDLILNPNGGPVGIGTYAPGGGYIVHASGAASSHLSVLAVENRQNGVFGAGLVFRATDTVTGNITTPGRIYGVFDAATYTAGRVTIQTPTADNTFVDVLTVKNGGVGISTLSPAAQFQIGKASSVATGMIGDDPTSTSAGLNGVELVAYLDGSNYFNCKTAASGGMYFRCGQGTEPGYQRYFMVVEAGTGNLAFCTGTSSLLYGGGGVGVIYVANATTVPTTNPTGGGILYCQGGSLMWRSPAGNIRTVAAN